MTARRILPAILSAGSVVVGLMLAPAAPAAGAAAAVTPHVLACNEVVALGTTAACDLPAGGGTARYRFSVPSADTVRFRAAVLDGFPTRTMTLSRTDGTEICTKSSFGQFECAVPAGGNYRLDVTLDVDVTVYTTIDSVLTATCGPPLELAVGNVGSTVHIADPGASWCAGIDVAGGEDLEMVLDVNTDQGLAVSVYGEDGALLCVREPNAFVRVGCSLTGDGYRLFATPTDDAAQDAVLIVTQISHPSGCVTRQPDAFGGTPSRHGVLPPHQQACYRFAGSAGQGVGVHLFAVSGPSGTLFWQLRTDAGATVCTGGPADPTHRLTDCVLPADGSYILFVSMLARDNVRYAVSLVDLSSSVGCVPVASTRWNTTGDSGTLDRRGVVDCATFSGSAGDTIRGSAFGDGATAAGLVTTADGTQVCEIVFRATCTLPAAGTYRIAVSTYVATPLPYRLWVVDMSSTAGCQPTSPDAFGIAPSRRARFGNNVAVCYTVDAPPDAAYYFRTDPVTRHMSALAQIRNVDGSYVCTDPGCLVPSPGTYLYVVTRASFADDPDDIGVAAAGLWRLDQPSNCASLGTSFSSAPASGEVVEPAKVDCHQFAGSAGDQVLVRTSPPFNEIVNRVFDRTGASVCFAASNACTLTGPGPYRMLTYLGNLEGSTYEVRVASLTRAAGCDRLAVMPFGRAPNRAFDLADPVDLVCYRITMPDFGQVGVRMVDVATVNFHPGATLYGNGASGLCAVSTEIGSCPVPGPGEYLLVLTGNDPASGTLGWFDMTSAAGCTTGPSLAFGEPPALNRINGRGAIGCMTLPLVANDKARLAFGPSTAGAKLHALMLGHTGQVSCDFVVGDRFPENCGVRRSEAGPLRLIVYADEQSSVFSGPYRMHAWRLNNPAGCSDIGSLRRGFGPLVGTLSDPNDEVCHLAQGTHGMLSVTTSNDDMPTDVPVLQMIRPNGAVVCDVAGSGSCGLLPGAHTYALLVMRSPGFLDFAGHYRVEGTCTTTRCGP